MKRFALAILFAASAPFLSATDMLLVIGAPGEADYAEVFTETAEAWRTTASKADFTLSEIETEKEGMVPRDQLSRQLSRYASTTDLEEPLWIIYIGHGSYDLRLARLNLHGPDVSTADLQAWLKPMKRPVVFVHGGSAGAPFLNALSGANRIIVTATESGNEVNYARFGLRFARAVTDSAADIDRDGQTSLLEAFVTAAEQTQAFYLENNRLATEHALIDDNGDGRGTPYDFFNGTRLVERPADSTAVPDGGRSRLLTVLPSAEERALTAEQRTRREALEAQVEQLRARKATLPEPYYFIRLERLFRDLAEVYEPSR